MITLFNYNSGELEIRAANGDVVRLNHDQANRLILAARMLSVDTFLAKLPILIPHPELAQAIVATIQAAEGSARWNLKETFARLQTVAPGYSVEDAEGLCETRDLIA